jgi:putative membrane-bound dehydrogenase-like protein
MYRQLLSAVLSAVLAAVVGYCSAAEPDYHDDLPRIPPLAPQDALASFEFGVEGFELVQVAAEPLVASPVALDFDADGRMYVVEMRDYSEQDHENLGRIRLLEDNNHDGRFDKATIFAEDLSWPTAVACANGGIFVGAAPHIYFLKDSDGDGRADIRQIVFTGFHRDNVQGLINSFHWGLDNRLHGATSTAGAEVRRADHSQDKALSLRGRDFSIDTRTLDIRAESGGGQHGLSFDQWGRKFVSSNSDHIQLILAEDRYLARNPYLAAPPPRASIAADGPQAEVFRISPVEPWRILRTRLRVAGQVPGPVEGGGRPAGYFTGATGVTIYTGDAWPAEFHGNAFIGDVGSNIVHRKTISSNGLLLVARRAEPNREFLASRDIWFRPAQFVNGPDGNLYVIDVYREVIEHPASLPPAIKRHLDLTSGRDRGRIYRIQRKDTSLRPPVRLSDSSLQELVALLEHPNGWHRQTASRLLYERNDKAALPLLVRLFEQSQSALGRMHALRALDGLGGLSPQWIEQALADVDPGVRRHAVQLAERFLDSREVQAALLKLVADPDLLVRYQLAFTLGEWRSPERLPALATLARRDAEHPWMRIAIQSSLSTGAADVLVALLADAEFHSRQEGVEFLRSLARQLGAAQDAEQTDRLARRLDELIATDDDRIVAGIIAAAFVEGAAAGRASQGEIQSRYPAIARALREAISGAAFIALDVKHDLGSRVQAIELLSKSSFEKTRDTFAKLLSAEQPAEIQRAAVTCLARTSDAAATDLLLARWSGLTPRLRTGAMEGLISRRSSIEKMLEAIENGEIARGDIELARVEQLRRHRDPKIQSRAKRLWPASEKRNRDDLIRAYQPALDMKGSADKGRTVFRASCVACHRAEGQGAELGPNLATVQNRGPDTILLNVLDPNREVNPQYVNYLVITKDGRSATGVIAGESATSITLARGEGQTETILRADVEEITSTGMSLMPEGLEKQIDVRAMADLLAYLSTLK